MPFSSPHLDAPPPAGPPPLPAAPPTRIAVLHVEDSPLDGDLAAARLRRDGLDADITRVDTRAGFEAALRADRPPDLILSDYLLPDFDGMSALRIARELRPQVPFIFVSGVLGEENAIDSLKLGATDYVLKQRMDRLVPSIRRALAEARERAERRRFEGMLRRAEDRLRFTLDAVHIGHWELDLATGRSPSRSALHDAIFGYAEPVADWSVDRFLSHVHPDDRDAVGAELAAAGSASTAGGRRDVEFECRVRGADGRLRWVWVKGVSRGGKAAGVMSGIVMDVTARKAGEQERERLLRSEQEAREAAEEARAAAEAARSDAERASRLKDDFLTTLSHELRTPLNAILGWAQLLGRGVIPPGEVPQAVEVIERNAKLQAQLVDDLLDMSRITSGKLRLEPRETDVCGVVRAAVAACRPAATAKRVELAGPDGGPAEPVWGDPARLQQVVWNLLTNAVKFTPAGGRVTVGVERVDGHVRVAVTDSGQGIDPAFLPHVFDRFRQQDGSTSRRHGGLGVGLSIVRHLVELHGGTVSADSAGPGRGSTFAVALPAADGGAGPTPDLSPPSFAGLQVLVVDDEADAREYVCRVLEDCGAEVLMAAGAAAALDLLTRHRPDVLLSDIGMPGQDGYDLIRQIRALPAAAGGATPAVAVTAYARPEDRQKALDSGFQTHLTKPVDPARLLAVVAAVAPARPAAARCTPPQTSPA
ncbi:MAG: Chemotaxis protein methyltransferase CheR [Phycisphaerales bacterium]|nr:Chemotaxis protein methyltransferase CheR [Phycisphaerales bacterium]